jgi:hypothetical protein
MLFKFNLRLIRKFKQSEINSKESSLGMMISKKRKMKIKMKISLRPNLKKYIFKKEKLKNKKST